MALSTNDGADNDIVEIDGDLHGNNVRIAGAEEILVDFAYVDDGPLTPRSRSLDVSLMMDIGALTVLLTALLK